MTPTAALGNSFGVSAVTVYRYTAEAIEVLAAQAPSLNQVLTRRARQDQPTILDGTIITTYRVFGFGNHKTWYCYRKHTYGINLQALSDHKGNLLWISDGLPGSTHDLSAARTHGIIDALRHHDLKVYGTKAMSANRIRSSPRSKART